jgi:serine phosphatase RsbU (regulator of sigma subunit)
MYLISALVTLIATSLDMLMLPNSVSNTMYINPIAILLILISLFLYYRGILKIGFCYGLLSIIILANIAVSFLASYKDHDSQFLEFFLRDSMLVGLLITLTAFIVNKNFALLYGALFISLYFLLTFLSGEPFLRGNMVMFSIVFLAYPAILYYFVYIQEKFIADLNKSNLLIREQNEEIQTQNEELRQQQEEIIAQRDQMEQQNVEIELKTKDIRDNINFAQTIQESILPSEVEFASYFPEFFILFKPKDAISGDFYWIMEKQGLLYIAAVDCTGHGVSGALVSMIMHTLLSRAIAIVDHPTPADVLNKIDNILQTEFNKHRDSFYAKIGMDIAMVSLDFENNRLQYSGAFNPLYIIRNHELINCKGTRHMIGIEENDLFNAFENQTTEIAPGDSFYLFSDGLPDQFGGPEGKKFGYPRLRNILLSNASEEMDMQKSALIKAYDEWRGTHYQIDDVLVIGIRI